MKISRDWLNDFVCWQGSDSSLEELLTRGGLTVEAVDRTGVQIDKVVVGQILESEPHPNADRLSVCRVADGSAHLRQIVCGAKNYAVGDKIPLALPGAVLPGNFQIKSGKLRGVESEGMMCSAKELGLGADSQGLLILSPDAEVGSAISTLFPSDSVLDLEVTANRPDWLSHLGVAREVAALARVDLRWEKPVSMPPTRVDGEVVKLDAGTACSFYTLRRIRNVKVGPSPDWLRRRLEAVGLRSINNVVDVTNYVMRELGQPLHAFDAAKIQGAIQVRRAAHGEMFVALDGVSYELRNEDTVIADAMRAVALGGVIGGEDSGVTEQTTEVLLESAWFDPSRIRRTARDLGIQTDSSHRFERGVDPEMVVVAADWACRLLQELGSGEPENLFFTAGELVREYPKVRLRNEQCRRLLGVRISDEEITDALERLGLRKIDVGEGEATWEIPSYRPDLTREVDLIEEVVRVLGIDRVTGRLYSGPSRESTADCFHDFRKGLADKLVGLGFCEAKTMTLVSGRTALSELAPKRSVSNPLGEEQRCLRASLLPGLLDVAGRNFDLGADCVFLFEIGTVFEEQEFPKLGILATGPRLRRDWRGQDAYDFGFFDLKGVIEHLVGAGLEWSDRVEGSGEEGMALRTSLRLRGVKNPLGVAGVLMPQIARSLDARAPVVLAEIDLNGLFAHLGRKQSTYQEVSKFPAIRRDLAIVVPRVLPYANIETTIVSLNESLLESIRPIDLFTDDVGEKLPADAKSIAISLVFRSNERTLNSDEVNAVCDRIRSALKKELMAEFRE